MAVNSGEGRVGCATAGVFHRYNEAFLPPTVQRVVTFMADTHPLTIEEHLERSVGS
jgi:hypothetical protein